MFFLFGISSLSLAQEGLGYYYDYYNHLYVFDKGKNIQLESNRVDSLKIGDDYLSYIDQKSNLRFYSNGETQTIEESVPSIMIATAHALVYKMQLRLMICENGITTKLAASVGNFFAGDDIVTWQALPSLDIMAYENGEIKTIESAISTNVINGGKAGKNIFAYSDLNFNFKIYFNEKSYDTQASNIRNYKCGKNIVAYIDKFNNTFNVFYNGEIKTISNQLPANYTVADDMVSYIDASENFMVYYKGESIKLESYTPTQYKSSNNIIQYYYQPDFKIFYGGKTYVVDNFILPPDSIQLGFNSALYLDNNNRAKYFYKGKIVDNFLIEQPKKMRLSRDLPVLKYGNNTIGFFYDGKLYEYETVIN